MAYLYKHMKLRPDFFEEPMLRATPAKYLNDPFECQFNFAQIQTVARHEDNVRGFNETSSEEDRANYTQVVPESLRQDLSELGIVAFTEDYSNLLMWAYYADEHRGMVVEFRADESWLADKADGRSVRHVKSAVCNTHELPARVVYRDSQPDFLLVRDACSGTDYAPPLSKMIEALLLTKGDKWIYEKEHRSVLELRNFDRLVMPYDDGLARFEHPSIKLRKNQIRETGKYECEIDMPADFDAGKNADVNGDGPRLGLCLMSRDSNSLHLFRVDPKMITGIYFGCRTTKRQVTEAVEKIRSNPLLKHVKLKQAVPLTDRFALKFEDIAEP